MSIHPDLDNAFAQARKAGIPDEKIRQDAVAAGWTTADINAAFASFAANPSTPGMIPSPQPMTDPVANPVSPRGFPITSFAGNTGGTAPIAPSVTPQGHGTRKVATLVLIIVILGILGGTAYAYVKKIGPFAHAPYGEDNLMSGLLAKSAEITTSKSSLSLALYSAPRDPNAKAFTVKNSNDVVLKEKYARDYERGKSVRDILSVLKYSTSGTYAASLNELKNSKGYYGAANISFIDPQTQKPFLYRVTENGSNFELTVTFETDNAISEIRTSEKYSTNRQPLNIQGKTVVFNKASYTYINIPLEPPKTFFEQAAAYSQYLPPEINVKGTIAAEGGNRKEGEPSEWKFGLDGSGDFGDLAYKVNVEALKKSDTYYLKINNIPSLFGGLLPPKGQWIKFSSNASSTSGSSQSYFVPTNSIAAYEDTYKKNKTAFVAGIKRIAELLDEGKVIAFRDSPSKEKVGDRSLYRYDVRIRKDAIAPFYRKLLEEVTKNGRTPTSALFTDETYLSYLEGSEFSEMFDYYDQNTKITLWVDEQGFPAIAKYSIRIVPPPEAVALKDKQIMLDITVSLDHINDPIDIAIPMDAKTYEEAMGGDAGPLGQARLKGKSAAVKANLSNIRPQAELTYDKLGGYGKKAFSLGPCKNTADTLFADKNIFTTISTIGDGDSSKLTCVSTMKAGRVEGYAISAPLPDKKGYSFCIDSTGNATEMLGTLKGVTCK
ncbi:MAG: hypothetical protein HZA80_00045 [Candidatus Taylorbacteria bacterium]|nr:hypothetical protein [Candidatus Taylorbacteria bacterium]